MAIMFVLGLLGGFPIGCVFIALMLPPESSVVYTLSDDERKQFLRNNKMMIPSEVVFVGRPGEVQTKRQELKDAGAL